MIIPSLHGFSNLLCPAHCALFLTYYKQIYYLTLNSFNNNKKRTETVPFLYYLVNNSLTLAALPTLSLK